MAKLDQVDMKSLARIGAAARLAELEREIAALRRMFPGLSVSAVDETKARDPRVSAGKAAKKVTQKADRKAAPHKPRRGRQTPMTAAEKQAVSDRMKSYWAARHAEKKAAGDKPNVG